MKVRFKYLVTSIIVAVLYISIIVINSSISNKANLLSPQNITTSNQNFSIAYDNEKSFKLVGTYQNQLIAYDKGNNKVWQFSTKGPIRELKIDEKSRKVYVGSEDTNIYILDLDTGNNTKTIEVERRIYSIDINEDASLIAVSAGVSAMKHQLLIYDNNGKQLWRQEIGSTSRKVAFNSDYSKILLANDRAEVIEFDLTGKEINKTKLDFQIVDLKVERNSKQVTVLTGKCTYYLLNESLEQISSSTFNGKGMSIAPTEDSKYVSIGTEGGDFYIATSNGKLLYSTNIGMPITNIVTEKNKILLTGLGDFVYEIDNTRINSIGNITIIGKVINILIYIIPIVLIVFIVLSFNVLSEKVRKFIQILIKHKTAYLLLLPTFILLIVFSYYPVFIALTRAFTDWSIHSDGNIKFVGFQNFITMLEEGYFLSGLKNLLILMATGFIKLLTVPLLVAELVFLMRSDKKKYWFRFLFVVPMVVPGIVSTLMWQNIYDPTIGLLNQILKVVGLENLQRVWLGDPKTAIWAIVFMGFPFVDAFAFLVYYGGLINIPSSLFEAAKVDGSNGWWNFTKIHLPLITPQMKMLIVLTFIGAIQNFMPILILTGGGPGVTTYVPGLELYYNATRFGRYGYACALGLVMFIGILIGTILNMKMKTSSEYSD